MAEIAAIILSGGFSRRMGKEKGFVHFKGKPLIERTLELASSITDNILVIANAAGYEEYGYPVYKDIMKEKGPLGGIHTGLIHSKHHRNLVLACDMPMLNPSFLTYLVGQATTQEDIVVPRHNGQIEPLCAIYSKNNVADIEFQVESDDLSLHRLIESSNSKYVDINESLPYYSPYLFSNVNSMEELKNLELVKA